VNRDGDLSLRGERPEHRRGLLDRAAKATCSLASVSCFASARASVSRPSTTAFIRNAARFTD
jgi:hypothetical protein